MSRKTSLFVAALLLLLPTRLLAGGPAWLCVPINGVTAENTKAATEQLTAKLKSFFPQHEGYRWGIQFPQHRDQSYLVFRIGSEVGLSDIEKALKGTSFSVPREKLHFFGDAILEIDTRTRWPMELLADLERKFTYVTLAKVDATDGRLLVTLNMPYPVDTSSREESVSWNSFDFHDFAADSSKRSLPKATPEKLLGYDALNDLISDHGATLKDVRWSPEYGCRPLGCVAVPASGAVASAKPAKPSPTSD